MTKSYEGRKNHPLSRWRRAAMAAVSGLALAKTASCGYTPPEQETPFNYPVDQTTTVSQPHIGGPGYTSPETTKNTKAPTKQNPRLRVCVGAFVDKVNGQMTVNPVVDINPTMKGVLTPAMVHIQTLYGKRQLAFEPSQAYNPGTYAWYAANGLARKAGPRPSDCGYIPVRIVDVWQAGESQSTIPVLASKEVKTHDVHDFSDPTGAFGENSGECVYHLPYPVNEAQTLDSRLRSIQAASEQSCLNTLQN